MTNTSTTGVPFVNQSQSMMVDVTSGGMVSILGRQERIQYRHIHDGARVTIVEVRLCGDKGPITPWVRASAIKHPKDRWVPKIGKRLAFGRAVSKLWWSLDRQAKAVAKLAIEHYDDGMQMVEESCEGRN